ncbi:MAG: type II toxin-antitoxin system PemK/MazF family toxin [Verrucomicrobiota bacterium]
MNLGDLLWVEFPAGAGRAQAGRRPAIVVQASTVSTALPTVLLIPLTSQQDALRFPGTVLVEPDSVNGLRRPSVALVFQLTAIDKRFFSGPQLGAVSPAVMAAIWEALDEITGRGGFG